MKKIKEALESRLHALCKNEEAFWDTEDINAATVSICRLSAEIRALDEAIQTASMPEGEEESAIKQDEKESCTPASETPKYNIQGAKAFTMRNIVILVRVRNLLLDQITRYAIPNEQNEEYKRLDDTILHLIKIESEHIEEE